MGRKSICKICKREMSRRTRTGKCLSCMMNEIIVVNKQMKARKGKYFKKWKHSMKEMLKKL